MTITDFSNLANQKWLIVNDGVMGGKSSSQFQINEDGNGVFLGTVSLENNGGFASVKNHEPMNLLGYSSILLHLNGDGKKYSFRLQTGVDGTINEWSYEQRFETVSGEWKSVELPLSEFKPTYRGRTPENVSHLDPGEIKRYGFLISDKQQGKFRLEIDRIEAVQ